MHANIHTMGVLEGGDRERVKRMLEEIMAKIFPNLMKNINLSLQEVP